MSLSATEIKHSAEALFSRFTRLYLEAYLSKFSFRALLDFFKVKIDQKERSNRIMIDLL